ncbi:hypothetical protein CXB51_029866 [Gossypium anomalum]|uniref:Uncharacterized protein n=1 Tax=Gossypium anomalum TaxID=47600 RepID=A0A8J5Y159_9ROSI|nr:hypothetical protein CXB51_029866 [Gossypium anomalum]
MAVPADLGFDKNCKQVVDDIVKVYSRIDILVNNAAEQYESSVEVNAYLITQQPRVPLWLSLEASLQLVNKGIRVNGVAPGLIWTPLIPASFDKEKTAQFGNDVPMKRADHPIEVAPCYVFLACNVCSSYITGQVLHLMAAS